MQRRMHNIILLCSVMCLISCTHVIFQPRKEHRFDLSKTEVKFEDVYFNSRDGTVLHGWWLPRTGADYKSTIVFLHGNAGNVSYHIDNAYWLTENAYDVFIFDYRGYGLSAGVEHFPGILDDIEAAFAYTNQRLSGEKFIVLGQSLGAALGARAVARSSFKNEMQLYMMVSGISDYQQVARDVLSSSWLTWLFQWPISLMINNDYRPRDVVADISPVPVVLVYSQQDEIIPYHHSLDLYEVAREPKKLIEVVGRHNYVLLIEPNRKRLIEYLDEVLDKSGH